MARASGGQNYCAFQGWRATGNGQLATGQYRSLQYFGVHTRAYTVQLLTPHYSASLYILFVALRPCFLSSVIPPDFLSTRLFLFNLSLALFAHHVFSSSSLHYLDGPYSCRLVPGVCCPSVEYCSALLTQFFFSSLSSLTAPQLGAHAIKGTNKPNSQYESPSSFN